MATITVTNSNDSGTGSLRAALTAASAGDTINFVPTITTIDLSSSLVISKNVIIEGSQPGSSTPGVTINGGGSSSNFSDFTINAGISATFDGLIIADGNATGLAGSYPFHPYSPGTAGGAAAGGIFDAGALTLTNSVLQNDTATGGVGGYGGEAGGGGAGGSAAGGIYVASAGSLTLAASDAFNTDSATGGAGGQGGVGLRGLGTVSGGAGGSGGVSGVNGGIGSAGHAAPAPYGGAGGAPGQSGSHGMVGPSYNGGPQLGAGGGGGGGSAFADVGGKGTVSFTSGVVTNESDDVNTFGSLRYELARIGAGGTITFDPSVTTIDLSSSLVISKNVTIEGARSAVTGAPGVTINGGGSSSNFSDFTINAGITATFDGLIIADGNATGLAGSYPFHPYSPGTAGGAAAGGIFDAGALTLTNSVLQNDTATGGVGGYGGEAGGGGAGGSAAGGIYVASAGSLTLAASDAFNSDSATGGAGGQGGVGLRGFGTVSGGAGGSGGVSGVNGGIGSAGHAAPAPYGGAGGAPGQSGSHGMAGPSYKGGPQLGAGGGGGGGSAFADVGGKGTVNILTDVVTNTSDNVNTVGSLRYELAHARAGDTITFDPSVTFIELGSSLVITKNVTIEGSQPGSTGTPGVFIESNGNNFADFTINAGVSATFDGLIIAGGHATGATGSYGASGGGTGGAGQAAAGGIYDAGTLTLTNSTLENDTATGGAGGTGGLYNGGGGAGGSAVGGIYVASTGTLNYTTGDQFSNNSATGGAGGRGGTTNYAGYIVGGGSGGAGGRSGVNGGVGQPGHTGTDTYAPSGLWGAGGAPGQPGSYGHAGGGGGGGNAFADIGGTGTVNIIPCYCPGTLIKTARGDKRVEKLKIGDKVMTASGALRPIKWIGRRSYDGRFVMGRKDILPICIRAGALDDNVPKRDLWISPHHAMYLDGVLIEAKDLVNGVSIVQAERVEKVEYFHVELDTHDVIIAEGALAESYLDDDNRMMFHNARDYDALYQDAAAAPAHYCAPRLEEGYEVEAARRRIALRAGLLRAADGERIGDAARLYRRSERASRCRLGADHRSSRGAGVPRYLCRRRIDRSGSRQSLSRRPRTGDRQRISRLRVHLARSIFHHARSKCGARATAPPLSAQRAPPADFRSPRAEASLGRQAR